MTNILSISNLSKRYGSVTALTDLSLDVKKGEVYGILGPNGSGKTTTLAILLDVLKADSGTFTWFDGMDKALARRRIGAILETPNFFPYLSARQNLSIVCDIKAVPSSDIDRVLKEVGLFERANDNFQTYSLGMKQRLALASAMLGKPDVLILDEPTNGLDPLGIAEVRSLILKQAEQGATIIMASHILDEVEKTCSHVAVLKSGKLLTSGTIASVLNKSGEYFVAADDMKALKAELETISGVEKIHFKNNRYYLSLTNSMTSAELNQTLFNRNVVLSELGHEKANLEANFLELVQ